MDAGMLTNPYARLYLPSLGLNLAAHQQGILCQAAEVARVLQSVDIPWHDVRLGRKPRRPESVPYQEQGIGAPRRLHYRGIKRVSPLIVYDGSILAPL
jgi:hypothetical protein